MGKYINGIGTSFHEKVSALVADHNATILPSVPDTFISDLVCVIDNGPFAAAAWLYDQREFDDFTTPDKRPRVYMIVPNAGNLAH